MSLVDYSESESSDDRSSEKAGAQAANKRLKRKRSCSYSPSSMDSLKLPPLPDAFHDLYTTKPRMARTDDPRLHAGRQRSTPHIEGNWPTHIFIEWHPSKEESSHLHDMVMRASSDEVATGSFKVHSFLRSELGTPQPLHISLSRPIGLITNQRHSFKETFANGIKASKFRPFQVLVKGFDWVANEEKNRWFMVLRIAQSTTHELVQLLRISNGVVAKFGQRPLYEEHLRVLWDPATKAKKIDIHDPITHSTVSQFHISIGWSLKSPPNHTEQLRNMSAFDNSMFRFDVSTVKVKIGNEVVAFSLLSGVDNTSNKIIGT